MLCGSTKTDGSLHPLIPKSINNKHGRKFIFLYFPTNEIILAGKHLWSLLMEVYPPPLQQPSDSQCPIYKHTRKLLSTFVFFLTCDFGFHYTRANKTINEWEWHINRTITTKKLGWNVPGLLLFIKNTLTNPTAGKHNRSLYTATKS